MRGEGEGRGAERLQRGTAAPAPRAGAGRPVSRQAARGLLRAGPRGEKRRKERERPGEREQPGERSSARARPRERRSPRRLRAARPPTGPRPRAVPARFRCPPSPTPLPLRRPFSLPPAALPARRPPAAAHLGVRHKAGLAALRSPPLRFLPRAPAPPAFTSFPQPAPPQGTMGNAPFPPRRSSRPSASRGAARSPGLAVLLSFSFLSFSLLFSPFLSPRPRRSPPAAAARPKMAAALRER